MDWKRQIHELFDEAPPEVQELFKLIVDEERRSMHQANPQMSTFIIQQAQTLAAKSEGTNAAQ